MAGAQASEIFNCTPDEFYKIVSDYERYPEFLNEVKSVRIVENQGSKKLVEYHISLIKSFSYRLWMEEEASRRIQWQLESGDLFKVSNGSWDIQDEGGKTRANYSVDASFKVFVPGPVAKALVNVNLPNMMAAYHRRVKQLYGK